MARTRTLGHWTYRKQLLLAAVGIVLLFVSCGSNDASRVVRIEPDEAGQGGVATESGAGRTAGGADAGAPVVGGGAGAAGGDPATSDAGAGGATSSAGAAGGHLGGAAECTPGASCSAEGVVTACRANGSLVSLPCTNGCQDDACLPTVLSSGWVLRQFPLTDNSQGVVASYSFSDDGLSALQTVNAQPSAYYLDQVLSNVEVTGQFSVDTATDDDLIGFVFGYQDPQHFYLFDWKQTFQVDPICGTCEAGASLKVLSSAVQLNHCEDFWSTSGNARVKVLAAPSLNPTGWLDSTVYDFRLLHRPGHIEIEVRQANAVVVSIEVEDDTYPSGKFGFYNYSQEQSHFQFFALQPK